MSRTVQVRGSGIYSRLEWVRREYGNRGLQSLLPELSAAGRNLIRTEISRTGWYNFPLFIELCSAIDRRWGEGDGKLNIEMARFGAHVNTPSMYHMFIRLGSVQWVLARGARLWSEHFSAGQLIVSADPENRTASAEIVDFPAPHICHSYGVLGFALGCIELSGARDVRGELVACQSMGAETTRLRCTWA